MFIYPISSAQGQNAKWVKNIDLDKTTQTNNPLCFENINGKVTMTIKKEFGENLVTISK